MMQNEKKLLYHHKTRQALRNVTQQAPFSPFRGIFALPAVALVLFLALAGCAETVRLADPHAAEMALLEARSAERAEESSLRNLPAEELVARGDSYLARGNAQLAKIHYAMAVGKKPDAIPALAGLGDILLQEGEAEKAQGVFARVLAVDGGNRRALAAMGRISRRLGDHGQAESFLKKGLLIHGDDPELLTELAITLDAMGREAEAEPLYAKVAALVPTQASAHNNLGFNLLLQSRYDEAIQAFSRGLRIKPGDKRIINNLATAHALAGQDQKALALMTGTVGEAGALNNLGFIHMTRERYGEAVDSLEKALTTNPRFYARAARNLEHLRATSRRDESIPVDSRMEATPPEAEKPKPVQKPDAQSSRPAPIASPIVAAKTGGLNVRQGPGLEYPILLQAGKGEVFLVLQEEKDWIKGAHQNGTTGWIHRDFIKAVQ